jgi:tetratricopeptide (TPR) repeat protein
VSFSKRDHAGVASKESWRGNVTKDLNIRIDVVPFVVWAYFGHREKTGGVTRTRSINKFTRLIPFVLCRGAMSTDRQDEIQIPRHNVNVRHGDHAHDLHHHEQSTMQIEEQELFALERIDAKCTALQQEGKYTEALENMEKGLVLRQHFFGSDSPEVRESCRTVGEMCNLLAMTYLQQEQFPVVLELLRKAEILTETYPPGRAVTLNNFACYYRRQGNLHKALTHLTEALAIEAKLEYVPNRADTHLNMCAVLSQLGRHQGALEHAQSALILLHEELFSSSVSTNQTNQSHATPIPLENRLDRVAVLGIAYHNVGVEQEFLKKLDLSIHSYKKGVDVTSKYLGADHGIVITLQNSHLTATRAFEKKARVHGATGDGISRFAKMKHSIQAKLEQPKTLRRRSASKIAITTDR